MNLANVITDLILIQVIVVILIDISGIVQSIEGLIARMLSLKKAKVYMLECSFCMNHHISVIYLLLTGALSLKTYAIVLVLCFLTSVTKEVLWTVRDFLIYLIRLVNRLF